MKTAYLILGSSLCLLFLYAGATGWTVTDSFMARTWGAKGASGFHHK